MKFKQSFLIIVFIFITISTYCQIDSLENRIVYTWKLNQYDLSLELVELDTSLTSFQNFNPLLKNTISNNYLGNLGTAAQPKIYFDRKKYETEFIFSEPYGIYFHLPKDQLYFNTKRQFTLFNYSNSGPKEESEQVLGLLHTQNVNETFNFGFDYDLISSDGRYLNQEVKQNLITVFSSYKKKGYTLHTNMGFNRVKAQENGGIDSLHYLGDNDYKNRRNIPVRLNDARTQVLNTNLYLAHEYNFGKTIEEFKLQEKKNKKGATTQEKEKNKGVKRDTILKHNEIDTLNTGIQKDTIDNSQLDSVIISHNISSTQESPTYDTVKVYKSTGFSLSHEMTYNSDIRKFFDEDFDTTYYNKLDIFIDSLKTHDEVRQKQFGNKISLNYKYLDKFSLKVSFFNEQMNYKYNIRPDTTISNLPVGDTVIIMNKDTSFSNNNVSFYLNTILFNHILMRGYGEYYISGYKKENKKADVKLSYFIGKSTEISLTGNYKSSKPDYFYENYTSNNFSWKNDSLNNTEELYFGFYIRNNKYKFHVNVQYGQIYDYLYLDTTAYVKQHGPQINILSAELYKHLKLGPVNSITRFVYQKSSNDSILNLPELNLYQSLYFERLSVFPSTGGKMLWQFGIDYRFVSSYMADGYMPTTGLFHRQSGHNQVDYHCFDVFASVKIKRARFYLKYNYLNSKINENYYFTAPYYPAPNPVLKFGLAWTFYD